MPGITDEVVAAPGAQDGKQLALWASVDRLVDRAPTVADVQRHRLDLFAARRLRALGRPVPPEFVHEERAAALAAMIGPMLLRKVRDALDGPILLFKGMEAASFYPGLLRPFNDIDLLVEDSKQAKEALLNADFVEVGDPELFIDIHHERPLCFPGIPLAIELHHSVKWPERLTAPSTREILESGIPSATGIDGVIAPPPEQHAVLLVAHAWTHQRLRRLIDLVDLAAVTSQVGSAAALAVARRWRVDRLWRAADATANSILFESRRTWAQRLWAGNLSAVRDRTVFEAHVDRWLSPFWALPPHQAIRALGSTALWEFTPAEGEDWADKGARMWRAFRNASVGRSEHESQLGDDAHKRRRPRS
jgi:hypothetical protein